MMMVMIRAKHNNKHRPKLICKDDNNDEDNDVNGGAGDVDDAEHLGNL